MGDKDAFLKIKKAIFKKVLVYNIIRLHGNVTNLDKPKISKIWEDENGLSLYLLTQLLPLYSEVGKKIGFKII